MRDAVIFDMDGTLCDTSGIVHLIEGADDEAKDFHAFHAASADCPAREDVVAAAKDQAERGRAVLVVTSREFIWRDLTLDWLVAHDVPYDEVHLRIVNDFRPDVAVKTDILERIVADGYRVVEAWEDSPDVAELWRSHDIEVHVIA